MTRLRALTFAALLAGGCSDAFDPVVPGPRPIVVFGVLNAGLDTQVVRVHQTMDPTEPDLLPLPVTGAAVSLISATDTLTFLPVDLPGEPGTAVATIPAFRLAPFRPQRGASYTLVVTTPLGRATGRTDVPEFNVAAVSLPDGATLRDPNRYSLDKSIAVSVYLSPQTLGYAVRMLLEYDVRRGAVWERERREIPRLFLSAEGVDTLTPVYPTLRRRRDDSGFSSSTPDVSIFLNSAYEQTIRIVHNQYLEQNVRTIRVLVLVHQADRHFFSHYVVANQFQDRLSVRVDQPEYSSIDGALGFFGSLATDTLAVTLPPDLRPR